MFAICRARCWSRLLFGLTLIGSAAISLAHDSPTEVIERLTIRMEREGRTADLLYRRASEYRILGKLRPAASDLDAALRRSPNHFAARLELARVQLAEQQVDAALQTIDTALAHTTAESKPAALMQRAEILLARENFRPALADADAAIAARPTQVDWYLRRSEIHTRLGDSQAAADGLKAGWTTTQSQALKVAWIDALIDAGQAEQAIKLVRAEMGESRFKSGWRIREARCQIALGEQQAARKNLQLAIAEIAPRLHPTRPDPTLLVDRGLAHALLGELTAARADLELALAHAADGWMTSRLEKMLAESDPASP